MEGWYTAEVKEFDLGNDTIIIYDIELKRVSDISFSL